MILAVDTETTGLDLYHSARPFFVSTCDEEGNQVHWEWEVDPFTREPQIPEEDKRDVRDLILSADTLVLQNAKFDATALCSIEVFPSEDEKGGGFPWSKIEDTLIAGHLLYSSRPHTLDKMVLQYLDEDITGLEKHLEQCCQEARREVRKQSFRDVYGHWRIAERDGEGMPSAKEKNHKMDMWLPLAVARELEYPPDHPWYTCTEEYAIPDAYWTLALWIGYTSPDGIAHEGMESIIKGRKLWNIYRERMKVLPIANGMERRAVTGSLKNAVAVTEHAKTLSSQHAKKCVSIATDLDYDLKMPKSGNNDSLMGFVFDTLKLPVLKRTETGNPSFDKDVIEVYEKELPADSVELDFITHLHKKRKVDKGLEALGTYARYWVPHRECPDHFRIYPNLNPTGTVQLRWSHTNPNTANISKQEGFNLREVFGPVSDREWWSLDAQNIELRIPTFEAPEPDLIKVFLKPKEPPYYGSYHLVIFDLLHPEKFREHGVKCKDLFESTWYQWVKNGNFAVIYGCQRKKADATYKVPGAFDLIRYRFPNIAKLADRQIEYAAKYGYVQTIPDKTVDPDRGFPIMASRAFDGGVMPTTPLNYHVSGTAMWWTQQAMIYCEEQLKEWRANRFNAYMTLQVHDELVFDFPKSRVSPQVDLDAEKRAGGKLHLKDYKSNLGRVRVLQSRMESCGEGINVPTPVGVEYNRDNWAEVTLKC